METFAKFCLVSQSDSGEVRDLIMLQDEAAVLKWVEEYYPNFKPGKEKLSWTGERFFGAFGLGRTVSMKLSVHPIYRPYSP